MSEQLLILTSSPHIFDGDTVDGIMRAVLVALIPSALAGLYFFGVHAAWLMLACMAAAVASEAAVQALRKKPITVRDGSALITGLLLALSLPPATPVGMGVLGSTVAIVLAKQLFGGLGTNPFNPALIGRAFLAAAFPVQLTTWNVLGGKLAQFGADALTSATPLKLWKMQHVTSSLGPLFFGNRLGSIGETSTLAILLGAAFLLARRVIDWRIPAAYLGTVALLSALLGQSPLFHLMAGGLMLGAFFMATDLVTSPVTRLGRWVFGIGAGLILVVIRLYGGLPEGVTYSILIMNGFTPLINRATTPRRFGEVKARA
ncbi:MAG: RnfABCDGE type electron transport complex subunit D [Bacillota bacterium]|nr:RnfABCDGE type electron transport complex subunit D [Bacillota bacterium]